MLQQTTARKGGYRTIALVALSWVLTVHLGAQPAAVTTADPAVPLDELELLLLPLDRGEMEVEAAAWVELVKAKVHELSDAEIAAKYKRLEIARAAEAAEAARAAEQAAEEAEKARRELAAGEKVERQEVVEAVEEAEEAAEEAKEALEAAVEVEQKVEEHEGAQEVTEEAVAMAEEQAAVAAEDAEIGAAAARRSAETDAEKLEKAAEAKAEVREAIFERVTELRNDRVELLARANLVLDKLEEKGGDVDGKRQYLAAVSGVQIDVTDTTATWATLVGWLKSPQGGMRWLKNVASLLAVLLASWVLAHLLSRLAEKALKLSDRVSELTRVFVLRTLRRIIIAVGIIAGLATMEINVGPVLAIVGAATFVLAFALQDSLGNLASGIMIMVFRPFDIGDVVSAAGARGKVHSMNIVSTTVKTPDNRTVVIPNRKIWGDVITNITGSEHRRVDMVFRVGHEADLDKAQQILERVLAENPLVLEEPPALVRVAEIEDTAVTLLCRPWAKTADRNRLRSEVTLAVKRAFDREGIPRPVPVQIHRVESPRTAPSS